MDLGNNDHVSHSLFNLCTLLQSPLMLAHKWDINLNMAKAFDNC